MEPSGFQPQHLENIAKNLIGDYGWLFVAGLVLLLFQSSIKKLAASLFVFVGGDYKTDDVVFVDGKPGRIIRVGFIKTVFFIRFLRIFNFDFHVFLSGSNYNWGD